jgi:predicted TIM-barrel fold metal-dependent hydrolase
MPYTPYEVIDCDGHAIEREQDLAAYGPVRGLSAHADRMFDQMAGPQGAFFVNSWVEGDVYSLGVRLRDMDREGIAVSVCFPTVFIGPSDIPDPLASATACRTYNDWFHGAYHAPQPERLFAPALVPMRDPEAAVREAERGVCALGARAIYLQPYAGEHHLDDPEYEPLYDLAERLNVPLTVHGARSTTEPLFANSFFRTQMRVHVFSHPWQQMTALADLVLGGVLERHPRLRVAFLEAGVGWVPWLMERLDEDFSRIPQDEGLNSGRPSDYLRGGNCFYACDPDEEMIPYVASVMGEDTLVYASDYPHWDCRFPDSVRLVAERDDLSPGLKRKILRDNGQRLYNL